MIEVKKTGQKVEVTLTTGAVNDIVLYCDTNNELFADLLAKAIERNMLQHISRIRENAYNAGWRDKSNKKKAKNKHHSNSISQTEYWGY